MMMMITINIKTARHRLTVISASMFGVACILIVTAAALSSASGGCRTLTADSVQLEVGAPLQLDCGVQGHFRHCLWETQDGRVFQVEDVHGGRHAGLRDPSSLSDNQCGIVVEQAGAGDVGAWTCIVFQEGRALTTVRNVVSKDTRACEAPFEPVGSGCFYFSGTVGMDWQNARDFCKSLSEAADLAVVDDCNLMHLLWNHILVAYGASTHWLGATDRYLEDVWVWVDGRPVTRGTPYWRQDEPNNTNGNENCLAMYEPFNGYFNDQNCTKVYPFICQDNSALIP